MNPITRMAGHYIRRLHQISVGAFLSRLSEHNIDLTQVQFAALSVVGEFLEIDQTSIARHIACDRATAGGVIDRLEKKGYVRRVDQKKDRRRNLIVITEDGRKVLEDAMPVVWLVQEDIMRGLDGTEQEELLRLLIKATRASNEFSRAPMTPG